MTTIQDTITYFDGSAASGKIIVTWPPFSHAGAAIAAGQKEYPIGPDGSITITCYPSAGVYYTATYQLDSGATYDEFWVVPDTPIPTTIAFIRVSVPAASN